VTTEASGNGIHVTTFAATIVGGTAGGTALTAGFKALREQGVRKGQARLLHEDLMHLQSTLARTYYQEGTEWWQDSWLLPLVTSGDGRRELFGAVRREEYAAVASALGWMDSPIRTSSSRAAARRS
jgi:hypothetical protein